MSALGLGLGALGSVLGALGNSSSASAQNRAQQAALDRYMQTRLGSMPLLLALGAGRNASALGRASLPGADASRIFGTGGTTPERRAQIEQQLAALRAQMGRAGAGRGEYQGHGGGGGGNQAALQQQIRTLEAELNGDASGLVDPGALDAAAEYLPGAQYERLANEARDEGLGQLGQFDTETQNMLRTLDGYGQGARDRINREADRTQVGLDRATENRYARMGAGASTLLPSAISRNTGEIFERRQNLLGDVDDQVTSQRLGVMGSRSMARTGLQTGLSDRTLGLRQAPINFQAGILGNLGQSGLGQNSVTPVGGLSPSGSAFSTFGNTLSGLGGMAMYGDILGGGGNASAGNAAAPGVPGRLGAGGVYANLWRLRNRS